MVDIPLQGMRESSFVPLVARQCVNPGPMSLHVAIRRLVTVISCMEVNLSYCITLGGMSVVFKPEIDVRSLLRSPGLGILTQVFVLAYLPAQRSLPSTVVANTPLQVSHKREL